MAAVLTAWAALAGRAAPREQTGPEDSRPTLLVIVVVDQMRADYVEQFSRDWTGGLKRLLDHGARFTEAAYPYLNTVTCVGHATISTGTFPHTHGMVLNEWWDRDTAQVVSCTEDPGVSLVTYGPPLRGGDSAHRLMVPTLTDRLREQLPHPPRIVTLSLKDRTAITLAGHAGDAVTWLDDAYTWATSSAFAPAPVPWVQRFVETHRIEDDFHSVWSRALEADAYQFDDAGAGEGPPKGWGPTFPHPLAGDGSGTERDFYERWRRSPFSDAYLGRLAEAAVDALKLGQGPGLDFLGVSLSALDLVGHRFGPRSQEIQDVLVGVDRTLGRLFDHLDRSVGRDHYVVGLTADHGVAPIPEQMTARGVSAGRVSLRRLRQRVDEVLEPRLGEGSRVAAVNYTDVYFARGVYDRIKTRPDLMREVLAALAREPGVAAVYTSDEVREAGVTATDRLLRAAAFGYCPGRSGDIIVVPGPYWTMSGDPTTHGSANAYDQRVPLFLMGAGIRPGTYADPVTPADLAPTLARLAGVALPGSEGRALAEALAKTPE
jgi:predicted AlkP superfamily pyrophosphatase or phosphodiesterase